MKFRGSKIVFISCRECGADSPRFRVYLAEENGEISFYEKKIPDGWVIDEEAELRDDPEISLAGYCPKHSTEQEE